LVDQNAWGRLKAQSDGGGCGRRTVTGLRTTKGTTALSFALAGLAGLICQLIEPVNFDGSKDASSNDKRAERRRGCGSRHSGGSGQTEAEQHDVACLVGDKDVPESEVAHASTTQVTTVRSTSSTASEP
jgi:hypothetical protein